jgi:hypothetical protein
VPAARSGTVQDPPETTTGAGAGAGAGAGGAVTAGAGAGGGDAAGADADEPDAAGGVAELSTDSDSESAPDPWWTARTGERALPRPRARACAAATAVRSVVRFGEAAEWPGNALAATSVSSPAPITDPATIRRFTRLSRRSAASRAIESWFIVKSR